MEKANFADMRKQDELQKADACAKDLKQNPYVRQLFSHNGISTDKIDSHPFTVQRWFSSYKPCLQCKGLNMCGQKQKGYFDNLVDDGMLHLEKRACKYMKSYLNERVHLNNFLVNDMPSSFETVSFEKISLENEDEDYLLVLKEAMQLAQNEEGMYLYGTMGSGKTYLASCACNYYAKKGNKVAFVHYPSFVNRMIQQINNGEYKTELSKLKFVHFLVIDDIGAESVTEWNRDSILLPILNERYENHLPTWFTSNEDLKSLEDHFRYSSKLKEEKTKSLRILERIKAMAKPVALQSASRRNYL